MEVPGNATVSSVDVVATASTTEDLKARPFSAATNGSSSSGTNKMVRRRSTNTSEDSSGTGYSAASSRPSVGQSSDGHAATSSSTGSSARVVERSSSNRNSRESTSNINEDQHQIDTLLEEEGAGTTDGQRASGAEPSRQKIFITRTGKMLRRNPSRTPRYAEDQVLSGGGVELDFHFSTHSQPRSSADVDIHDADKEVVLPSTSVPFPCVDDVEKAETASDVMIDEDYVVNGHGGGEEPQTETDPAKEQVLLPHERSFIAEMEITPSPCDVVCVTEQESKSDNHHPELDAPLCNVSEPGGATTDEDAAAPEDLPGEILDWTRCSTASFLPFRSDYGGLKNLGLRAPGLGRYQRMETLEEGSHESENSNSDTDRGQLPTPKVVGSGMTGGKNWDTIKITPPSPDRVTFEDEGVDVDTAAADVVDLTTDLAARPAKVETADGCEDVCLAGDGKDEDNDNEPHQTTAPGRGPDAQHAIGPPAVPSACEAEQSEVLSSLKQDHQHIHVPPNPAVLAHDDIAAEQHDLPRQCSPVSPADENDHYCTLSPDLRGPTGEMMTLVPQHGLSPSPEELRSPDEGQLLSPEQEAAEPKANRAGEKNMNNHAAFASAESCPNGAEKEIKIVLAEVVAPDTPQPKDAVPKNLGRPEVENRVEGVVTAELREPQPSPTAGDEDTTRNQQTPSQVEHQSSTPHAASPSRSAYLHGTKVKTSTSAGNCMYSSCHYEEGSHLYIRNEVYGEQQIVHPRNSGGIRRQSQAAASSSEDASSAAALQDLDAAGFDNGRNSSGSTAIESNKLNTHRSFVSSNQSGTNGSMVKYQDEVGGGQNFVDDDDFSSDDGDPVVLSRNHIERIDILGDRLLYCLTDKIFDVDLKRASGSLSDFSFLHSARKHYKATLMMKKKLDEEEISLGEHVEDADEPSTSRSTTRKADTKKKEKEVENKPVSPDDDVVSSGGADDARTGAAGAAPPCSRKVLSEEAGKMNCGAAAHHDHGSRTNEERTPAADSASGEKSSLTLARSVERHQVRADASADTKSPASTTVTSPAAVLPSRPREEEDDKAQERDLVEMKSASNKGVCSEETDLLVDPQSHHRVTPSTVANSSPVNNALLYTTPQSSCSSSSSADEGEEEPHHQQIRRQSVELTSSSLDRSDEDLVLLHDDEADMTPCTPPATGGAVAQGNKTNEDRALSPVAAAGEAGEIEVVTENKKSNGTSSAVAAAYTCTSPPVDGALVEDSSLCNCLQGSTNDTKLTEAHEGAINVEEISHAPTSCSADEMVLLETDRSNTSRALSEQEFVLTVQEVVDTDVDHVEELLLVEGAPTTRRSRVLDGENVALAAVDGDEVESAPVETTRVVELAEVTQELEVLELDDGITATLDPDLIVCNEESLPLSVDAGLEQTGELPAFCAHLQHVDIVNDSRATAPVEDSLEGMVQQVAVGNGAPTPTLDEQASCEDSASPAPRVLEMVRLPTPAKSAAPMKQITDATSSTSTMSDDVPVASAVRPVVGAQVEPAELERKEDQENNKVAPLVEPPTITVQFCAGDEEPPAPNLVPLLTKRLEASEAEAKREQEINVAQRKQKTARTSSHAHRHRRPAGHTTCSSSDTTILTLVASPSVISVSNEARKIDKPDTAGDSARQESQSGVVPSSIIPEQDCISMCDSSFLGSLQTLNAGVSTTSVEDPCMLTPSRSSPLPAFAFGTDANGSNADLKGSAEPDFTLDVSPPLYKTRNTKNKTSRGPTKTVQNSYSNYVPKSKKGVLSASSRLQPAAVGTGNVAAGGAVPGSVDAVVSSSIAPRNLQMRYSLCKTSTTDLRQSVSPMRSPMKLPSYLTIADSLRRSAAQSGASSLHTGKRSLSTDPPVAKSFSPLDSVDYSPVLSSRTHLNDKKFQPRNSRIPELVLPPQNVAGTPPRVVAEDRDLHDIRDGAHGFVPVRGENSLQTKHNYVVPGGAAHGFEDDFFFEDNNYDSGRYRYEDVAEQTPGPGGKVANKFDLPSHGRSSSEQRITTTPHENKPFCADTAIKTAADEQSLSPEDEDPLRASTALTISPSGRPVCLGSDGVRVDGDREGAADSCNSA
ncbi:unnamed protein product [Amoebophrya sp. A120]|nr:unnamed protein product [Amoebophrya sp. A120]|eukprot:GSA120T00016891001.1